MNVRLVKAGAAAAVVVFLGVSAPPAARAAAPERASSDGLVEVEPSVRLFVRETGPRDGRPVVFLHGWPLDGDSFEYQTEFLAENGYRCLAVDLRGFGRSDKPWEGYTLDRYADDVRAVLTARGVKDATLVGFSLGGAVALRYMARHRGERVARLVLMGAAAPRVVRTPDFPQGVDRAVFDGLIAGVAADRAALNDGFGKAAFAKPLSAPAAQWLLAQGLLASPRATAAALVSVRDGDQRADIAAVKVPTLVMHGVRDQVVPIGISGEVLAAGIKGARLLRFEESGHGLFLDEKDRCNAELLRFVSGGDEK
jgi:non-heme chloroperoxidase